MFRFCFVLFCFVFCLIKNEIKKEIRGPVKWGKVSRQSWQIRGFVAPWENFKPPFEKGSARYAIETYRIFWYHYLPKLSKKKWNSNIHNFLVKFSVFAYISLNKGYFELGHDCQCDIMLVMLVLTVVCMEIEDP